jgi:hypothetical protein
LNEKNSPLRNFLAVFMASLTPEQLEEIAGQDASSRERRESLEMDMELLKDGK